MPTPREKACQHYRDEDIRMRQVITEDDAERPIYVEALVRGYRGVHRIHLEAGVWTCTCDLTQPECAHRAAVQMVCGYVSAASKPSDPRSRPQGGHPHGPSGGSHVRQS